MFDIPVWFDDGAGRMKPGKAGLTLSTKQLRMLARRWRGRSPRRKRKARRRAQRVRKRPGGPLRPTAMRRLMLASIPVGRALPTWLALSLVEMPRSQSVVWASYLSDNEIARMLSSPCSRLSFRVFR
jgi:hypothetical protein